jgi:hypothetical protein
MRSLIAFVIDIFAPSSSPWRRQNRRGVWADKVSRSW